MVLILSGIVFLVMVVIDWVWIIERVCLVMVSGLVKMVLGWLWGIRELFVW